MKSGHVLLWGERVSESLSPGMHNQWFHDHALSVTYLAESVPSRSQFLQRVEESMRNPEFIGANITHPYKGDVCAIPGLKQSPVVRSIAAANTLYHDGTSWSLENTDVAGVVATLRALNLDPTRMTTLFLLGAGGAAKAALFAFQNHWQLPRETYLWQRGNDASRVPSDATPIRAVDEVMRLSSQVIVIQCTPLGHHQESFPFAEQLLMHLARIHPREDLFYFDVVYANTPTLQLAKSLGIKGIDGKCMLRAQAEESFQLWRQRASGFAAQLGI